MLLTTWFCCGLATPERFCRQCGFGVCVGGGSLWFCRVCVVLLWLSRCAWLCCGCVFAVVSVLLWNSWKPLFSCVFNVFFAFLVLRIHLHAVLLWLCLCCGCGFAVVRVSLWLWFCCGVRPLCQQNRFPTTPARTQLGASAKGFTGKRKLTPNPPPQEIRQPTKRRRRQHHAHLASVPSPTNPPLLNLRFTQVHSSPSQPRCPPC